MYRFPILVIVYLLTAVTELKAQRTLNPSDGFPDLGRSSAAWVDFNNDGGIDVALSGINGSGSREAGIYFNSGNGSFSNSGFALAPVSDGSMAVNDFNLDGLMDLLVTGMDDVNTRICHLYKNQGAGVFSRLDVSFEGVSHGNIAFTDLNNDGKPDILLNGLDNQNVAVTLLYLNDGGDSFRQISASLEGTGYGDLLVFDYNRDNFPDILISGLNINNQRVTKLYLNKGQAEFKETETVLPPLRSGGMASADMNNDGFPDIYLSGNTTGNTFHAAVYLNNVGTGFVLAKTFAGLTDGGAAWGDFNNDGFSDLAIYGFDNTDLKTFVFQNSGGLDFIDTESPLPGMSKGECAWIDYNNDKRLDLFLTGYSTVPFTSLYSSEEPVTNTFPSAPADLKYSVYADSVVLSWIPASDTETNSEGLTYSIYIGTSPGAMDVFASPADISTGSRRSPGSGNIYDTVLILEGLPEGTYYWAVQAIDPSYGVSPFSVEASFVSCSPVSITGTNKVCINSSLLLEAGAEGDEVRWYSITENNSLIGTGNALNYLLKYQDTIIAQVDKPLGCTVYDSLVVDVFPLPEVHAGEDTMICPQANVRMLAVSEAENNSWYRDSNEGGILSATHELVLSPEEPLTLVSRAEDLNGCTNTDTVRIGLFTIPLIELGEDREACYGDELEWMAGLETDSVNWYSQSEGLLIENSFSLSVIALYSDVIRAVIYNQEGCVSFDSVNLLVSQLPVADAGQDHAICQGDSILIGSTAQGQNGYFYSWTPASSLDHPDISAPKAAPVSDTEYILLVRDENGCENSDTTRIFLNPETLLDPGKDTAICVGRQAILGGYPTASGSPLPYTFQWIPDAGLNDPASPNPVASPDVTTVYSVITKAGDCLADTAYIVVTVNPLPLIDAGEDFTIGAGESAVVSASGSVYYEWFPEELFSDNKLASPVVYPNGTATLRVYGKDYNGCYGKDSVKVTVRSELFVPNLFTPNDDGVNDKFRAHGFGIDKFKLKVYDRWGRLVFESNELHEGWDGRINGLEAEVGHYVWTVEGSFYDGSPLHFKGESRGLVNLSR